MLEIIARDLETGARRGLLNTSHGTLETPAFMPVGTQGTVKAITQQMLEEAGAEIILGNTYHLYLRPGHLLINRMGGLHSFIGWQRPVLTDSGGFQVFSLNELRELSVDRVEFQSHIYCWRHFQSLGITMERLD